MYQRLDALKARILVVSLMFLASACVIQRANDQGKTGEEPVQPTTPAAKAEPEKAETAVAKAPTATPTPKTTATKTAAAPAKPADKKAATEQPAKIADKKVAPETPAKVEG